ncbi:thioesterase family protein [Saccharomonospora sp. NPDC046836]|uniref:thioesterase family protein n=1 Tax=Saccharomonospora sp. NPDC046836 TaxID=3156921 RepID=UPI0033E218F8
MSAAAGVPTTTFAEVSALTEVGAGRFTADVSPEWTIGGKPNGGYLLSILGRAAATTGSHPHVVAASAHYLRSPEPGLVDIEIEPLRAGRSASQLRARMSQDGAPCVEALLTASELDGVTPHWGDGVPSADMAPFDECARLEGRTPGGMQVNIMDQVEVRLEPESQGFLTGKPAGRGELRGWLALPGGDAFDAVSLLFAVDAFPPATLDIELTGWVPTLELTAYVRALPAPGPVRVLHKAQLIAGNRVDEACFVWDATGRLVAQSTQLAGIRLG